MNDRENEKYEQQLIDVNRQWDRIAAEAKLYDDGGAFLINYPSDQPAESNPWFRVKARQEKLDLATLLAPYSRSARIRRRIRRLQGST